MYTGDAEKTPVGAHQLLDGVESPSEVPRLSLQSWKFGNVIKSNLLFLIS